MRTQQINHVSGKLLIVLAFISLLTVVTGYFQRPYRMRARRHTLFTFRSWRWHRPSCCSSLLRIGRSVPETRASWRSQA